MKRIVILGGGVGGLSVARGLRFADAQVTLVDRNTLANEQRNVQAIQGEAVYLDARQRRLILADRAVPYDLLVVAAGSEARYGRADWKAYAPSLKSADDVRRVREKLRDGGTAVVIVGGGVAGVELAAVVARADRTRRVVLVDEGERLLRTFPERLAREAQQQLGRMGVEIRCGLQVIGMDGESLRASGVQGRERILSRAILWAGGTQGSAFGKVLQAEIGAQLDEAGRVTVSPDLTVAGHPEIFAIGDLARAVHEGSPLDGLATVASQQGRYVASAIRARMAGYDARPFEYVDQGRFVILGRGGIGVLGDMQLRGTAAWLAAKLARRSSSVYSAATASST